MVGKIQRLPLREVWKHEALAFTTWLVDNTDVLSDALGTTLQNAEREQAAGDFSVDLVAEDDAGNVVIIENQLEKSNHDHLGKLITYVAALGARTAVWIVADPRPEHVSAIAWLNESRLANFYLLKVEAIKIGDSEPAPLLTLITGPSEESQAVGDTKKEIAERYTLRQAFWAGLLNRAKPLTKLHSNTSPGQYSWIATSAGKGGISFNYTIKQHQGGAELYIDRGKDSEAENRAIFDKLAQHRQEIEQAFGSPLEWARPDERRFCRIRYTVANGGYKDDQAEWPKTQDAMIDGMIRLEKVLRPYIQQIQ